MRFLLIIAGLLNIILLSLILLVRLAEQTGGESRSPVFITPDCHPPCWNGIYPGETQVNIANQLLLERSGTIPQNSPQNLNPYYMPELSDANCTVNLQQRNTVIVETRLLSCHNLSAGDLIAELGQPTSLAPNFLIYTFNSGVVRVRLRPADCRESLSPFTQVDYISLSSEANPMVGTIRWHGFAPNWHYHRFPPQLPPLAC